MKIGDKLPRPSKLKISNDSNIEANKLNKNFSNLMQQKQKQYSEELLKKILTDIDEQGKKLTKLKNLKELKAYKTLIKYFIDEALNLSISLENQYSYDRHGRSKRYKIIREIDEKIMELTETTLQKEANQIKILEQIGEIRGLLINLYS